MLRKFMFLLVFTIFGAACFAQDAKNEPFRQAKGPENQTVLAEQNPMSPPPPASQNSTRSVDGRVIAAFSVLWIAAIVIAMTALLRAEVTDKYHGAGPDALKG